MLRVFFDWAKLNRMVVANPVLERPTVPSPAIRHYPIEVTRRLCLISTPDVDPTEGLILYLILVHACSIWELQHVRIPVLLPFSETFSASSLLQSYYLSIPKAVPSRGRRSPGRPREPGRSDIRLDFPDEAAPWLKPLLERFEKQRQEIVKNTNNPYLLVIPGRAYRQTPVSAEFVRELVGRASLHILGASCNARTLRQTAAVVVTDMFDAGILLDLGWEEQQAFAYAWAPREMIPPRILEYDQTADLPSRSEPLAFPSP